MAVNGHTVIQLMEQFAPKYLAVENDRIGLQLGTLNKPITKVLVALDVTVEVVEEAIRQGAELIIAHHAIIFRPLSKIDTSTPSGKLYELLIKHDIAVYISHTNLDVADGGVNDLLADQIGIAVDGRKPLDTVYEDQLRKLVVYVPSTHQQQVQEAMWKAGAGQIGNYSHCSFVSSGTGTFLPQEGTNPFIGETNKLEKIDEIKIETIFPISVERKVISAMIKAHPYEEPAYDIYSLQISGKKFGLGRCGKLMDPVTLGELAAKLKKNFDIPSLRVVGDLNTPIKKAAVLGGSGSRYVRAAKFAGADVLITGDIDYHTAHDAVVDGMTIIDAGHNIEKVMKQGTADWLNLKFKEQKLEVIAIPSSINTEIFTFIS